MSRFKIGQRVVAVRSHKLGDFKKGDEFIIDGFGCCPKCGIACVYLKGMDKEADIDCSACGNESVIIGRVLYREECFAPLTSLSDAIEYRLKVSEPELEALRVKEVSVQ